MNANMYCDILKQSMIPSLRRLSCRVAESQQKNRQSCMSVESQRKYRQSCMSIVTSEAQTVVCLYVQAQFKAQSVTRASHRVH